MSFLSLVSIIQTRKYQADESGSPSEITIIGQVSSTGSVAAKTTTSSSTLTSNYAISTTSSTLSGSATSHTSSSNNGVAVGAGVGVSVGLVILGLIAGGFYFYGKRKGRKSVDYLTAPGPGPVGDGKDLKGPVSYYSPVPHAPPSELPQSPRSVPPSELSHSVQTPRSELPVDRTWATMNTPWTDPSVY